MRARSAKACAVLRRAASDRSSSPSFSLSSKAGNCRLAIDPPGQCLAESRTHRRISDTANFRFGTLAWLSGLLPLSDALVQVADDHSGQALVVHEQALPDRIGVLLRHRDRLAKNVVRLDAAVDVALDEADPVLDDLRLFAQIFLAARVAVARHDRLDVERPDLLQSLQPLPRVAFLQPGSALVENVVAGEDDALLGHVHRGLRRGVAGVVDDVEGMVADMQHETVGESHARSVRGGVIGMADEPDAVGVGLLEALALVLKRAEGVEVFVEALLQLDVPDHRRM